MRYLLPLVVAMIMTMKLSTYTEAQQSAPPDSDGDGYWDSTEQALGTPPNDSGNHPGKLFRYQSIPVIPYAHRFGLIDFEGDRDLDFVVANYLDGRFSLVRNDGDRFTKKNFLFDWDLNSRTADRYNVDHFLPFQPSAGISKLVFLAINGDENSSPDPYVPPPPGSSLPRQELPPPHAIMVLENVGQYFDRDEGSPIGGWPSYRTTLEVHRKQNWLGGEERGEKGVDNLVTGDFDGDGDQDLIVSGIRFRYVTVNQSPTLTEQRSISLFINSAGGFPTEPTQTFFLCERSNILAYSHDSLPMVVADFDKDGKDDLAIARLGCQEGPGALKIALGVGSPDYFNWYETEIGVGVDWIFSTSDIDNDGDADLISENYDDDNSYIKIYLNQIGSWGPNQVGFNRQQMREIRTLIPDYSSYPLAVARDITLMATGDLDDDGRSDLAVVHENHGDGSDLEIRSFYNKPTAAGEQRFYMVSDHLQRRYCGRLSSGEEDPNSGRCRILPTRLMIADVDGNGMNDMVLGTRTEATSSVQNLDSELHLYLNQRRLPDGDNDGIPDKRDNCPQLANAGQEDSEGDGIGNACDNDSDNDGFNDDEDNCPQAANSDQANHDRDQQGDLCDPDDDNDGFSDVVENELQTDPRDPSSVPTGDFDGDFRPDAIDSDDDNDGRLDSEDAFPYNPQEWRDLDGDGIGDNADPDDDGDFVPDLIELRWGASPEKADTDGDGCFDGVDAEPADPRRWNITPGSGAPDSDLDGLRDDHEADLGLQNDPSNRRDADGDYLTDWAELAGRPSRYYDCKVQPANYYLITDPLDSDTDDDGWNDLLDKRPRDPNNPPFAYTLNKPRLRLSSSGPIKVPVNQKVKLTVLATDMDRDLLYLILTTPLNSLPGGATFQTHRVNEGSIEGRFQWTPDNSSLGRRYLLIFEADDKVGNYIGGSFPSSPHRVQTSIEIDVSLPSLPSRLKKYLPRFFFHTP